MTAKSYQTMTPEGLRGLSYSAESIDEAAGMAEADGYNILDYADPNVLVISNYDQQRQIRHEALLAAAVERAMDKLTVLEYNALALHIRAQVLADEEAKDRNRYDRGIREFS